MVVNPSDSNGLPVVYMLEKKQLREIKHRIQLKDPAYEKASGMLKIQAEEAMAEGLFSVVYKKKMPPSKDKHDYLSSSPYWWPNPETPNGLPYVNKDGRVNPETRESDRSFLFKMIRNVETLSLACYYFDNRQYGTYAVQLIRNWFLNPETKMNPHLEFAQGIPGICTGRGVGIIDTMNIQHLIDAVGLLDYMGELTEADEAELKKWFESFLNWLLNSKNGKEEYHASNNHGTWFDVQVCIIALYTGNCEIARRFLEDCISLRIEKHIAPDGSQPFEIVRTRSFHYSVMNLVGLFCLARLGEFVDLNIWNVRTEDRRSLKKAMDFLMPYINDFEAWPYPEMANANEFQWERVCFLLSHAYRVFGDVEYLNAVKQVTHINSDTNRGKLLYLYK